MKPDSSFKTTIHSPERRSFLSAAAWGTAGLLAWKLMPAALAAGPPTGAGHQARSGDGTANEVWIVAFTDSGQRKGLVKTVKVKKSDAEWRKQLSEDQFNIARKSGTEAAYTGEYYDLHDKGLYRCICCENAVFSSDTKFDSGTGWPSFWAPLAKENILTRTDNSLAETGTEVLCKKCDAHLGHVFDDGPEPTHLRYCLNSASLRFVKFKG